MDFLQEIYLGMAPATGVAPLKPLSLSRYEVEAAAGYAGSCHVLEMGRHYDEYVRYRGSFPPFPRVAGFPTAHYQEQLDTKSRAQNVTGNIGEIVAAVVARRTLKIDLSGIAHLKTSNAAQTPDYLLRRSPEFDTILSKLDPAMVPAGLPLWWPAESKATSGADVDGCVRAALRQLASYWYRARNDEPGVVGFGIVLATSFAPPRRSRVYVFAPKDRANLLAHLDTSFTSTRQLRDALAADLSATGSYLKNYA